MLKNALARKGLANCFGAASRRFGTSVYVWAAGQPRLGPKAGNIKAQISMQKGVPEKIEFFEDKNIQKLRIGIKFSAAIAQDGGLYMFGGGNWGVLGQGNEKDVPYKHPVRVERFDQLGLKVVDVQLGECHTVALTDDGSVWTWGYAGKKGFFNWMYSQEVGALGHGDKETHMMPKRVKYFSDNNIKVKSITSGLFHCTAMTPKNDVYVWGRGLYGVLGNGANAPELSPVLNEDIKIINDEDPSNPIVELQTADEFNVIRMKDGTLYAWGKNDKGQMGTPVGVGMDIVECENIPALVELKGDDGLPVAAKRMYLGQNTQIIQSVDNDIYLVGLKLHYTPKKVAFNSELVNKDHIDLIACGRKHFIMTTHQNEIVTWGNVFKGKTEDYTEGFSVVSGDHLFDGGKVTDLEVRYGVFGALVKH